MITFTQQMVEEKVKKFCENQFSKEAQKMENTEDILDYCIRKAWADATQRERFKGQKSKIIQNKDSITSILKKEIENLELFSNYDVWHNEMCSRYDAWYNEAHSDTEHENTYGIWQKLINMTFKYMYCRYTKFPNIDFSKCHCPIDSIIAQRVVTLGIVCEVEISDKTVSIARSGKTNWNNMEPSDYENVRKNIQDIIKEFKINNSDTRNPTELEFDFLFW